MCVCVCVEPQSRQSAQSSSWTPRGAKAREDVQLDADLRQWRIERVEPTRSGDDYAFGIVCGSAVCDDEVLLGRHDQRGVSTCRRRRVVDEKSEGGPLEEGKDGNSALTFRFFGIALFFVRAVSMSSMYCSNSSSRASPVGVMPLGSSLSNSARTSAGSRHPWREAEALRKWMSTPSWRVRRVS